jgi:integrase
MVASALASYPEGDHTDPATPGLQLRVRPSSRTWLLRYRWRDEWVRIVLGHYRADGKGMSLVDARTRALELRKSIDDGIDPRRAIPRRRARPAPLPLSAAPANPGDMHTVDFLVREFVELQLRAPREKGGRKRPQDAEALLARDVLPKWTGRDARTIKGREVVELLDGIVARGSPVQANRTVTLLRQMFDFGIDRETVDSNPVRLGYRPGGKENARERVLTDPELAAYLADPRACLPERLAHATTVLLLTGQRRGELALARWADVDFAARTWTIPDENAKTGRGHIVPLSDWAVAEFRALKRLAGRSPWVLASKRGDKAINATSLSVVLARCLPRFKKAGVEAFVLHDLRRTCRTGLSALKVKPHIGERVLNHAQGKVEGAYDRYAYLDEKREALEKWAQHLSTLRADKAAAAA